MKSGIFKHCVLSCFLFISFGVFVNASSVKVFNVLDYGAKGDGKTLDSPAFQKAIDAASSLANGSQVLVPAGHKFLLGTIQLKSDIDFHLDGDAELFSSTQQEHFINDALILANNANNLKITGTGFINGRDMEFMTHYDSIGEWWQPKPFRTKLFILTRCNNLQIRDITFGNSSFWGLHMLGCENVVIENVNVRNNLQVPNCDGIDPDHCRNVIIRNCHIVSGDDAIVVKATRQNEDYGESSNILVQDCILETQDAGLKIGTETTKDIHHITFERCKIISGSRGLCIQLRDEGNVHDITFRDIEFISRFYSAPWWGRGEAISFTAIPRTPETKLGSMFNIRVSNVKGISENSIRVNGTKESRIHDVVMENVEVTMIKQSKYPGGVFDNRPTKVYTDLEPHSTPAFSIRFADSIQLNNCRVFWSAALPDYYSNGILAENTTGLVYKNFKGGAAHPLVYKEIEIK